MSPNYTEKYTTFFINRQALPIKDQTQNAPFFFLKKNTEPTMGKGMESWFSKVKM
jgi:hypothetical protein